MFHLTHHLRDGLLITAPEAFAVLIPLPRGTGGSRYSSRLLGRTAVAIEIPVRTFYSLLIAATLDIGESVQNYPHPWWAGRAICICGAGSARI